MSITNHPAKVIVLGMGNLLLKDEGIGVHIAHTLQELPPPGDTEVEVIDGATSPDMPLSFKEADKLIVIDAVQAGGEPGAIYRFHPEDVKADNKTLTSLHQISLLENLWLMERFGQKLKNVVIIGIEPEDMNWGLELSPKLQGRIPQIIQLVLEEISSEHSDKPEKGE